LIVTEWRRIHRLLLGHGCPRIVWELKLHQFARDVLALVRSGGWPYG
ncbi:MAG: hypothetical protein JWQ31_3497, partial [Mycobacterium sp.]|nr:hypothetical protein [Mycobacterium sp.]